MASAIDRAAESLQCTPPLASSRHGPMTYGYRPRRHSHTHNDFSGLPWRTGDADHRSRRTHRWHVASRLPTTPYAPTRLNRHSPRSELVADTTREPYFTMARNAEGSHGAHAALAHATRSEILTYLKGKGLRPHRPDHRGPGHPRLHALRSPHGHENRRAARLALTRPSSRTSSCPYQRSRWSGIG